MRETAWYHQWFGTDYLQLYQHRSPQEAALTIDWILDTLRVQPPARVLDLACGSGRHSQVLARRGFRTTGLDLSWPLLLTTTEPDRSTGFDRVRGDMRSLPFAAGHFDLVLSLFTSFGYFESQDDDYAVLSEVARLLTTAGWYVLDYLNTQLVIAQIVPAEETIIAGKTVSILRWVDEPRRRVEKRILIHEAHGAVREFRESVRLYSREELQLMMEQAGFKIEGEFGRYDGSPFQHDSPRLILTGRKNA